MYTIRYISCVIRGNKNFGSNRILKDLSKSTINTIISDLDFAYGKNINITGECIWKNKKDTHTITIYKNGKLIKYKDFKNER